MKRLICLAAVLALCLCMAVPAFAAEFVPSISYKDGLEIISATMNGKDVKPCLIVSSIKQAQEKTTDITQDERDLLLNVYQLLNSGEMKLPLEGDYVIRDLVDVSFCYNSCRQDTTHEDKDAELKKAGTTVKITFEMGVGAQDKVTVLVYTEGATAKSGNSQMVGQWVEAESVKNNGDGTVTVELENICPVAFVVDEAESAVPTGDTIGNQIIYLAIAMAASAACIIVLVVAKQRNHQ